VGKKPPLTLVGSEPTAIPPPRKLSKAGTHLWNGIQREYRITDYGGVELLMQACLTADRVQGLSDQIDQEGLTVRGKSGLRSHPLLKEELAARAFIVRTLTRLGVTDDDIKPIGRPLRGGIGWSPHQ
jgi:hypothetical protein